MLNLYVLILFHNMFHKSWQFFKYLREIACEYRWSPFNDIRNPLSHFRLSLVEKKNMFSCIVSVINDLEKWLSTFSV